MNGDTTNPALPPDAGCLTCGYALRDLPTPLCPECGQPFDPADNGSYSEPHQPWWIRWARAPHTQAYLILIMATLVLLGVSNPGDEMWTALWICAMGGPMGGLILIALYLLHCGAWRHARSRGVHPQPRKRAWLGWLATPCALLLMLSAIFTNWPMTVRFAASRIAFDALARNILTGTSAKRTGWIGLYHVQQIRVEQGEVFFETGAGMIDPAGFVYAPARCTAGHRDAVAPGWCVYSD